MGGGVGEATSVSVLAVMEAGGLRWDTQNEAGQTLLEVAQQQNRANVIMMLREKSRIGEQNPTILRSES